MPASLHQVTTILRDVLHDDAVELCETTRFEDLSNWDSMDLIAVVVEVECRYDLQFELPEIDRVATVDDLMRMIEAKQAVIAA